MKTRNITLVAGLVALLTACGGGGSSGGSSSGGGGSTATNTQSTGVLSDSPVDGVSYTTNRGKTGVTQNGGKFDYTLGDTVTFTLGEFVLGSYKPTHADETVTPVELTKTISDDTYRDNAITNLLVLLQSLDTDGDPSNGITIADETTFSAEDLTLIDDPDTFAANPALDAALPEGGSVVTSEQAKKHFAEQRLKDLAGIWRPADNYESVLRINSDGGYITGDFVNDEGAVGVERGKLKWDPITGEAVAYDIDLDTQINRWGKVAGAGLADNDDLYFRLEKNILSIVGEGESSPFVRVQQGTGNSIVGAWAAIHTMEKPETSLDTYQFIFFDNGTYAMLDPIGDMDPEEDSCSGPGVEAGHYTISQGKINLSNLIVDTNGCGGLHDFDDQEFNTPIPYSIDANTNTMTWNLGDEGEFKLVRISTLVE